MLNVLYRGNRFFCDECNIVTAYHKGRACFFCRNLIDKGSLSCFSYYSDMATCGCDYSRYIRNCHDGFEIGPWDQPGHKDFQAQADREWQPNKYDGPHCNSSLVEMKFKGLFSYLENFNFNLLYPIYKFSKTSCPANPGWGVQTLDGIKETVIWFLSELYDKGYFRFVAEDGPDIFIAKSIAVRNWMHGMRLFHVNALIRWSQEGKLRLEVQSNPGKTWNKLWINQLSHVLEQYMSRLYEVELDKKKKLYEAQGFSDIWDNVKAFMKNTSNVVKDGVKVDIGGSAKDLLSKMTGPFKTVIETTVDMIKNMCNSLAMDPDNASKVIGSVCAILFSVIFVKKFLASDKTAKDAIWSLFMSVLSSSLLSVGLSIVYYKLRPYLIAWLLDLQSEDVQEVLYDKLSRQVEGEGKLVNLDQRWTDSMTETCYKREEYRAISKLGDGDILTDDDKEKILRMKTFPAENFSLSTKSISYLIGLVASIMFGAPLNAMNVRDMNYQFTFGKNVSGAMEFLIEHGKSIMEFAYEKATGNKLFSESALIDKYDRILREYLKISAMENGEAKFIKDPTLANKIKETYREMLEINQQIAKSGLLNAHEKSQWVRILTQMMELNQEALNYGTAADSRQEPIAYVFVGPKGMGKSTITEIIMHGLYNKLETMGLVKGKFESTMVYARNEKENFWSKYNSNKFFVLYDDILSSEDPETRGRTANEILHCVNKSPMAVEMPDVASKGNTMFNSKVIIATTNDTAVKGTGINGVVTAKDIKTPHQLQLTSTEAFGRRWKVVHVTLNKGFVNEAGEAIWPKNMQDVVDHMFSFTVFSRWTPTATMEVSGIDMRGLITHMAKYYEQKYLQYHKYRDLLNNVNWGFQAQMEDPEDDNPDKRTSKQYSSQIADDISSDKKRDFRRQKHFAEHAMQFLKYEKSKRDTYEKMNVDEPAHPPDYIKQYHVEREKGRHMYLKVAQRGWISRNLFPMFMCYNSFGNREQKYPEPNFESIVAKRRVIGIKEPEANDNFRTMQVHCDVYAEHEDMRALDASFWALNIAHRFQWMEEMNTAGYNLTVKDILSHADIQYFRDYWNNNGGYDPTLSYAEQVKLYGIKPDIKIEFMCGNHFRPEDIKEKVIVLTNAYERGKAGRIAMYSSIAVIGFLACLLTGFAIYQALFGEVAAQSFDPTIERKRDNIRLHSRFGNRWEMRPAQGNTSAFNGVMMKIINNNVESWIEDIHGTMLPMNIQFLCGRIAFLPKHVLDEEISSITLNGKKGAPGTTTFLRNELQIKIYDDSDCARVIFGRKLQPYSDLRSFIFDWGNRPPVGMVQRLGYELVDGYVVPRVEGSGHFRAEEYCRTFRTIDKKIKFYDIDQAYIANFGAYSGACGLPYILDTNSTTQILMGFHVGGVEKDSLFVPIKREYFEGLDPMEFIAQSDEVTPAVNLIMNKDFAVQARKGLRPVVGAHKSAYYPKMTNLQPSVFAKYRPPFPITMRPALMKPEFFERRMETYGRKVVPGYNKNFLKALYEEDSWKGAIRLTDEPTIMISQDEALLGAFGIKSCGPVDLTKSLGEPYVSLNLPKDKVIEVRRTKTGELDFYKFHQVFQDQFDYILSEARKGKIPRHVVRLVLKDELLKLEKIERPRLFGCGSKDRLILDKMLFSHMMDEVHQNRRRMDVQVGTNPHSLEWGMIYHDLTRDGWKIGAGDFSEFDFRFPLQWVDAKYEIIKKRFPKEMHKELYCIMIGGFCPTLYVGKSFYETVQMISGKFDTADSNSECNSVMHRVMWKLLVPKEYYYDFDKYVRLFVYGDDSIFAVHPEMAKYFNMRTLAYAFQEYLGWIYTDSSKSVELTKEFITIDEAVFLSRKFRKTMHGVFAPLDKISIENMLMWTEDEDNFRSTCLNALIEAFHHGEAYYDEIKEIINSRIKLLPKGHQDPFPQDYHFWLSRWKVTHSQQ